MQAIQTKYFGPSNVKGSRVKATCAAKSIFLDWDDALDSLENHRVAARVLGLRLGWEWKRFGSGSLKDGSYVHVFIEESK